MALLGSLVVASVLAFMAVIGVPFTVVLYESINRVVENVSHSAFAVLAIVGTVLLIDPKRFSCLPSIEPPQSRYPCSSSFSYGFFLGAIHSL